MAAADDFRIARPGYQFQFPRDHFSHPEFKTEWWYYTGHVATADGGEFGFQLTFFRERVAPLAAQSTAGRWRIEHLYLAHFAITDLQARRFHYTQRMHRGALGIAGATVTGNAAPRIWNGDWSAEIGASQHRLRAHGKDFALELSLAPTRPPVIHGEHGVSRKGPAEANASHYYSFTRLRAEGLVRISGRDRRVTGLAWMDHEFSSSQLSAEQAGWDWLGLHLDDGADLMIYQLRARDGTRDPNSSATYVPAQGAPRHLRAADFQLEPVAGSYWESPRSGARYPLKWRIRIAANSPPLEVEAAAALPDQELVTRETTDVTYWEGMVRVSGERLTGTGYLEMTGYARGRGLDVLRK